MNWKGFGRKLSWPNWGTISGVTEENPKNLDHNTQFRSRDLNGDLTYVILEVYVPANLFCSPSSYTFYSSFVSQQSIFFFILSRVRLSLGTAVTTGLLYQPQMIGDGDCGEVGGMKIGRGHRSTRRKPAPAPLLSTTNLTWLDPGLNPDRRGGKPATNRLSYGAALTAK
jgi:hypothetical protein